MAKTNETEINRTLKRFGSKIVLDKLKELYDSDPLFTSFCEKFEEVFQSEYKNLDKRVSKIYEKHNFKKVFDRNCFVFLCVEHEFRYNLKQIGYERYMIFTSKSAIDGLTEKVPGHKEYIDKIKKFNELWAQTLQK